ncbi:hypothetical protein RhiirA4_491754 [Rhizophagus irregularis]|uniref:Uncharacterized protein n=1 Tax=Rhizophagus irregularis TaxID=588596 RepID=A0A2I1HWN5_9GLOM|nr:hypothetical protein RhiirA4_491754 [Rhizophagus irregularis]
MSLIYSKFDFMNKPWWRPDYDDRAPQYFISSIKHFQQAILLSIENEDELFWKGFIDLHREHYLMECISAEGDFFQEQFLDLFYTWLAIFAE